MSSDANKKGIIYDIRLIGRIVRLAKPYKKLFVGSIVLMLMLTFLAPLRPYLVQHVIDQEIANKDFKGIQLFSLLILFQIIAQSCILFGQTYVANLLGQSVIEDLRMRVYRHILSLNSAFFDKSKVGTLVTRSVSDIETISNFFSQGFISIIGELLQIIVVLSIMLATSWKLTLISLTVFPVLVFASEIFRRGVRKSFQIVREQVSKLNAFVQEQIVGMEVVQIFGKEEQEFEKFEVMNRAHRDAHKKSVFHYAVYFPIVDILSSVSLGLIIWWSAEATAIGSAGLVASFYLYINMIFRPVRFIADRFNTMQMGMVASERIFELLDDHSAQEVSGDRTIENIKGNISFENVWFAYIEEDYVLKDITFEIREGKSLAIVGATGAGKSSIINLVTKLYSIQNGCIKIDGYDINDLDLSQLRKEVAVVLQDVFLFAGSIRDNINLKDESISQDQMDAAAQSIDALDFILNQENGWDEEVQERGSSLSVGQRQLISFIRAIAADPKILILDEATSSVDSETEALIQCATHKLMKGRTSIVIAHRLSTIREADSILVLDRGRIVEKGNHNELVAHKGAYYELVSKQYELT